MSSRENILKAIQGFQTDESLSIKEFESSDNGMIEQFIQNATLAGAEVFTEEEKIKAQIKKLLDTEDYFIYHSDLGVAENGALWCCDLAQDREKLFLTTNLIIKIDPKNIVGNMAEAYDKIALDEIGFGTFVAGPSKTADIEQSLVLGAHGAMSLSIILWDEGASYDL